MKTVEKLQPRPRFFLSPDYASDYLTFSLSSDEDKLVGPAIFEALKTAKTNPGLLLDIGSADGRISEDYLQLASRSVAIEPNPILYSLLRRRLPPAVRCVEGTFPAELDLSPGSVDAIIASHVLYHVDDEDWTVFFESAASLAADRGLMILTLWNQRSHAWQLCSQQAPSRWIWTAESVMEPVNIQKLSMIGFEFISQREIHPVIRTYTPEAQAAVLRFLFGVRKRDAGNAAGIITQGNAVRSLSLGLGNAQTVLTFRRKPR